MEQEPQREASVQEKVERFVQLMRDTREEFTFMSSKFKGPLAPSPFLEMLRTLDRLDESTKNALRQNQEVQAMVLDFESQRYGPLPDYGKRIREALKL